MMKAQKHLSGPLCTSKKKRDLRRHLLLSPRSKSQEVPQKEKEVEGVRDTKMPDAPESQADSPKNQSGSDEPEKGAPQQEIVFQRPMNK
jgi:hypothetical protein